jgi:riboflavin synthase
MFTGIVEELGHVRTITPNAGGARLDIEAKLVVEDAQVGDSIAVNGCCLTVVDCTPTGWSADAVTESLARTNLGDLEPGDPVNLERPLRLADRLGGHLVQGHVDGTGVLQVRTPNPDGSTTMRFDAPAAVLRYVVQKGSITVDGISLTVAALDVSGTFEIAVIPHTLAVTTLGTIEIGRRVNLEVDVIAKYVERLAEPFGNNSTGHREH